MPEVNVTGHLYRFFPQLPPSPIEVEGATVREVVDALEAMAPGIAFYVCDERGEVRMHVNVFVGDEPVVDRKGLSDQVGPSSRVTILQALSGG